METSQPIIVLLRQDLRLEDNPALWHAAETRAPLVVVYILDDETPGKWKIGTTQRWWLHHSLSKLKQQLEQDKITLILKRGRTLAVLTELMRATNAQAIYFNRCYEPFWLELENTLNHSFIIHVFNSALFSNPGTILTQQGTPYKVFTQFWNALVKDLEVPKPLPKPSLIPFTGAAIPSDRLDEWNLLPHQQDWASEFSSPWEPGEAAASQKLDHFIKNTLSTYPRDRDFPGSTGTSLLSPHLHFGEISLAQIYYRLPPINLGNATFLRELGWREFAYHLLYHFPHFPEQPFQASYARFPWTSNPGILKAWQEGRVGYPIVDAGMRQLRLSGYMHNRARMIVASFLTKDLLIPWQEGEAWFWDTLLDADLANNSMNWQWNAGCGVDAAPFFRIINPKIQAEKFDPAGVYIKQWVPELIRLPVKYIHEPWEAPPHILEAAGVKLGETYPYPIIDHAEARIKALKYFSEMRKS